MARLKFGRITFFGLSFQWSIAADAQKQARLRSFKRVPWRLRVATKANTKFYGAKAIIVSNNMRAIPVIKSNYEPV